MTDTTNTIIGPIPYNDMIIGKGDWIQFMNSSGIQIAEVVVCFEESTYPHTRYLATTLGKVYLYQLIEVRKRETIEVRGCKWES